MQELIKSYANNDITSVQFLDEVASFVSNGQEIEDIVLNNFPELMISMFPLKIEGNTLLNGGMDNDVSMQSHSSIEKGKDYMLKLLGIRRKDRLKEFMYVIRPLTYLMDPWRPESLSNIALSKSGQKFYHRLPIELVLTERSIELILN